MNSPENSTPVHDLRECRKLMRGGSKTFFAASLLLPARVREPARALYAFCRLADDAIDLGDDPAAAMTELRGRLDAVYAGRPGPVLPERLRLRFHAPVLRHAAKPSPRRGAGALWAGGGRPGRQAAGGGAK